VLNTTQSKSDHRFYSYALVAFGLFIGILSYIRFYNEGFGTVALDSIWGYTNTFAAFLVLEIFVSSGIYLDTKDKNIKRLISVIPMFFIFLLFLTVSRGGYIALFVGGVAFVSVSWGKIKKIVKDMLPVLIGSVILIAVGSPKEIILANLGKTTILAQFVAGVSQNSSLWDRVHMAKLAVDIFLKKPLTGFGLGTFRYTFSINEWVAEPFRIDPHSLFFKFLAETGLIGTLTFFSMIGYFLFKGFNKAKDEKENFLYKGIFAGLIGILFHMCIDVDIYPIMFILLFYTIALLVPENYVKLTSSHKKAFVIVGIILVLIVSFDLLPKSIASTYAARGENPSSLSDVDTAIDTMKKAIHFDSKSSTYYFYLGELISKSQIKSGADSKTAEMISYYAESFALNPYDYRGPFKLGMNYLSNKENTAIDYLEIAERLYPTNPNIQSWLSVAYCYIQKDTNKSYEHLKKAEDYSWGSLDLSFAKGVYELAIGNKVSADKYFSTLSFYDDIYKKAGAPESYSQGVYNLQLTIIKNLEQELGN
jgi:hypothetical protein